MASKTTFIPRYLLPQYGALWRTTPRSNTFARPLNAELGQVLVRYASKTSTPTSKSTTAANTAKATAAKVAAPKAAAPKAASTKTTTKSAASKAAKASAPTKPPAKAAPATKPAPAKTAPAAATSKAPTPKTPTPPVSSGSTPAKKPVLKTEKAAPAPAAKPAPEPVDPSKPRILEKPERFNPPSHGARLPRSTPKHYGGPMTDAELQAQTTKTYPGLPPPENTWSHWFINSRGVHLFITLGTLTSLAIYTFASNFNAKSPFAHMIPPISEFPRHPFQYLGIIVDVMRLHEEHESALTAEKRRRRVEDVTKRNEYRKAHGMEPATGFWGLGTTEEKESSTTEAEPQPADVVAAEATPIVESEQHERTPADEFTPDGKRKKFLGIF